MLEYGPLSDEEVAETAAWLACRQKRSGEIPWSSGGKMDPWDHVHAAMGLATVGKHEQARSAYRYLARTQEASGGWPAERRDGVLAHGFQETNHAAYLATGLWHFHRIRPDVDFLAEMWPTLERAMDFVVRLQLPSGAIAWAYDGGRIWRAPLLAGSSSIHGSLVCAIRIAERLGHHRPRWHVARARLARALRHDLTAFVETDLPETPGRYSMDWYYPVLGGAVRGEAGRMQLLDTSANETFVREGVGCRCVREASWYTVAETCELVLALHAVGLDTRAREIMSWTAWQRTGDGAYWTGMTHPTQETYPEGEQTTWTAAAVLIAHEALYGDGPTCELFEELDGRLLDPDHVHGPQPVERHVAPEIDEVSTAAAE